MKRIMTILAMAALVQGGICWATVRHVPSEYATLQAGINAAVNGDTVLVDNGNYFGSISIMDKDSIIIKGNNTHECKIISEGENSPIILISNCSNITIMGFTLRNYQTKYSIGVYIENSSICIRENIIKYLEVGIFALHSQIKIIRNEISNCWHDSIYPEWGGDIFKMVQ